MAYSLPQFNLLASLWTCDATIKPANGPADFVDVPCQKYAWSRGMPTEPNAPAQFGWWIATALMVQLRFPRINPFLGSWVSWTTVCVEVPQGTGQYYRTAAREVQHEGFPNEYCILTAVACNDTLLAVPPPHGTTDYGQGTNTCGD